MELFGFQITKKEKSQQKENEKIVSFVENEDNDGAILLDDGINSSLAYDFEISYKNDKELIEKYRTIAQDSEIEWAIDDIINEALSFEPNTPAVSLDLSNVDLSDTIKDKINEEFKYVLSLLNFDDKGDEIFRRWYVDGRLLYHKVVISDKQKEGIKELRYIDPVKIKKVRETKKQNKSGVEVYTKGEEYFVYTERNDNKNSTRSRTQQALKIPAEAVTYTHSGIYDVEENMVLSYLHKALKPYNQLSDMEASAVIYRLARAPERRVFYVDIGNLPKTKAEQYMRNIMSNYKNKMVYDARTGSLKDQRHHMSMMEDIWLPRREGSRGTQVDTLQGGQNLGELDEVLYFRKKLYKALHIPSSRIDQEATVNLGRGSEITRDELKFTKFVTKLRKKFSHLFSDILKTQLILKRILTEDDWDEIKNDVEFAYNTDSYFTELKEAEIMGERLNQLREIDTYVGKYFSLEYVRDRVLRMSQDEQKEMDKSIASEIKDGKIKKPEEEDGGF